MPERQGAITFKGNPMTLVGNPVKEGQPAPDFTVTGNDLKPVKLSDYKGKTVVISVVPSLDTKICDIQTRKFNEEATKLDNNTVVLTISLDLPFAQKRWCGAAGVDKVVTLSDYKDRAFGEAFGLRIKELGLLARAVYVIDKQGKITYQQIVPEATNEPDYDPAIKAAKAAS